jgi:hypothetical protein
MAEEIEAAYRERMGASRAEAATRTREARRASALESEARVRAASGQIAKKVAAAEADIRAAAAGARAEVEKAAVEATQELVARRGLGERLEGAGVRVVGVRVHVAGRLGHAVEQLLRGQAADRHAREEGVVVLGRVRPAGAGPLVRLGVDHRADDELQVEVLFRQGVGQLVQQRLVRHRVVVARFQHRLQDAHAEEVLPQMIDGGGR